MLLAFRQRIFVILVALTAVPTALAVVGWALAVRTVAPSAGGGGGGGGGGRGGRGGRPAESRRAGVRGTASGAARAGNDARRRAGARARGGAVACVPGGGAWRGARDQESVDGDANRGGPGQSNSRTIGQAGRSGNRRTRRRNTATRPAREGVLGIRAPAGGPQERSGPR